MREDLDWFYSPLFLSAKYSAWHKAGAQYLKNSYIEEEIKTINQAT